MYLANNSRPDIAFAVNQVARYANNPRQCHEIAVKRIGRYLKGSLYTDSDGNEHTRGTIFKPPNRSEPLQVNLWADADFAGAWTLDEQRDPDTARSRTGYIVTLNDLPLIWSSRLQTEISTSTAEAEYSSLASGMRALIPLRHIFKEIATTFKIPSDRVSFISHAFEDNQAALYVATANPPRLTARNKHWNIKHHWFRSHLGHGKDCIKVLPIPSQDQRADVFTKALTQMLFEKFRKLLMGW